MAAEGPGTFNDGHSAARHEVTIRLDTGGLHILHQDGGIPRIWPYDQLRAVEPVQSDAPLRLTSGQEPDARLQLDDPTLRAALAHRAPALFARGLAQRRTFRTVGLILLALALVALALWQGVPRLSAPLARLIPITWEKDIALKVRAQLLGDAKLCDGAAGRAALSRLTDRLLASAHRPAGLKVNVADHDMVNAFALPGGQVIIMRGLISQAEHADEVAAVLAHEIGHVHHRHPTQLAIRAVGIGVLSETITGDGSFLVKLAGDVGRLLVLLGYNRDMEREADDYGRALLAQAGLPTEGMVRFFQRLRETKQAEAGKAFAYLSSHPPLDERIAAVGPATDGRRVLDAAAWRALRQICE